MSTFLHKRTANLPEAAENRGNADSVFSEIRIKVVGWKKWTVVLDKNQRSRKQ